MKRRIVPAISIIVIAGFGWLGYVWQKTEYQARVEERLSVYALPWVIPPNEAADLQNELSFEIANLNDSDLTVRLNLETEPKGKFPTLAVEPQELHIAHHDRATARLTAIGVFPVGWWRIGVLANG